ncbi:MAG: hypothetical protein P8X89_22210, partial [Reinekea sp.]
YDYHSNGGYSGGGHHPHCPNAGYSGGGHDPYHSNAGYYGGGHDPYHSNGGYSGGGHDPYHSNAGYSGGGHDPYHSNGGYSGGGHDPYHSNGGYSGGGHDPYHSNGGYSGGGYDPYLSNGGYSGGEHHPYHSNGGYSGGGHHPYFSSNEVRNSFHSAGSSRAEEGNKAKIINSINNLDIVGVIDSVKEELKNILPGDFNTPKVTLSDTEGVGRSWAAVYRPSEDSIIFDVNKFKNYPLSFTDKKRSMTITLSHELTHAWQNKYAPDAPSEDKEGHATWSENKFAERMGMEFHQLNNISKKALEMISPPEQKHLYITMADYYRRVEASGGSNAPNELIIRKSKEHASPCQADSSPDHSPAREDHSPIRDDLSFENLSLKELSLEELPYEDLSHHRHTSKKWYKKLTKALKLK